MRRRFTTSSEPVRVLVFEASVGCRVLRTVGHRYRCNCGAIGACFDSPALARAAGRRHVFDKHVE